jgi:hypothetical protein
MAEYINRDELIENLKKFAPECYNALINQLITKQPTADVVEVKHGEWVHTDKARHWTFKDECSECTYHEYDRDDLSYLNYCPHCGAKMDGGKAE